MVVQSLFTGVSGLQSHFSKMDTLSNNISNVNTTGFKKSNVVFKSFLAQQTKIANGPGENRGGTNPQSTGLGTQVGSVNLNMSQGQLERTGINTDVALQGDGFFATREAESNSTLFTRAGSFDFDSDGKLVDPANGNIAQGAVANVQENGEIGEIGSTAEPEDIQVTEAMETIPGSATTFQEIAGNLNSNADTGIDPVTVDYGSDQKETQVRFKFERYHPQEKMYRFSAEWAKNPPSGKKVGDSVTDQITGRELEGIMQLNDDDQVTGLFRNPDANFNNGIEQLEVDRDNSADFNVSEDELTVRDQANLFQDLEDQGFNGEMRITYGTSNATSSGETVNNPFGDLASNDNYVVQWQDQNDNWNNITQETASGVGVNEANAATTNADEIDVGGLGTPPLESGDRIRITDETDGDTELATIDSIAGTTLNLENDLENSYQNGNTLSIDRVSPFVGDRNSNERLQRNVNLTGNGRDGELKIGGGFAEIVGGTSPATGDKIYFETAQADNEGLLNQTGQEVKNEFRWGGQDGRFRVSSPSAAADNDSQTSLDRVFNYDESNIGDLGNSTHLNDIPNKEFNVIFSGESTYHVAADTQGTKGNTGSLRADAQNGEGTAGTPLQINDINNYAIGDMIKISDSSTGNEEALVVEAINDTGAPGGAGEIEVSPVQDGNVSDGSDNGLQAGAAGGPAEYTAADSEIKNLGTVMTDESGNLSFSISEDEKLYVDTNPATDVPAGPNDSFANPTDLSEVGVSIAAENWRTDTASPTETVTAEVNDEFNFTLTEGRSESNDRGFGVVRGGGGSDTQGDPAALFMPSGTESQPSPLNFAPNQSDTSGILEELDVLQGSSATASVKDPESIQAIASSDVFDSVGNQHTLNYTFEKQKAGTWIWSAEDPTPVNPDEPELAGFGKLSFTENGQLETSSSFTPKTAEDLPPPGPEGDLEENGVYFNPPEENLQSDPLERDILNPDEGPAPVKIDPDFTGLTQFSGESNTQIDDQDGIAQGSLTDLRFNQSGVLQGSYNNGERRDLAQLSIANFQNAEGLSKEGSTYFGETANSGEAQFFDAGNGGTGTITPGALERSNVELSAQFTKVISTQRGFQANTRTITTSDQMVQSVLQLI